MLAIPFAYTNENVGEISATKSEWMGTIASDDYGLYTDLFLVLIFGGIPWQVYFQRVLSAKTEKTAMYLSYAAAVGCFIAGIPPIVIGVIARSTGRILIEVRT